MNFRSRRPEVFLETPLGGCFWDFKKLVLRNVLVIISMT